MAYGIDATVQQKADAYRGNPAPLEQQYAQNQQLIDLLALQKIKSDKEAAARQMQMAMAQQQAAQGLPATIKDQREKEVLDMTKQEIAQQATGVAQQQQQQQQEAMQRMLQSGIAQNAAPNVASMAGGGIVAFAGPEGSYVEDEELSFDRLPVAGKDAEVRGSELSSGIKRLLNMGAAEKRVDPVTGRAVTFGEYKRLVEQRKTEKARRAAQPQQTRAQEPAPAAPQVAAPAAPAAPQVAAPRAPAAPQPDPFRQEVEDVSRSMFIQDPQKAKIAEDTQVEQRRQLTPEQRKVYEEGIAGLRERNAAQFDPERMRRERLQRGLMAAAGGGGFAAAGTGALNTREAQEAAERRAFEALQGRREGLIGIERDATKEGIAAGQKAFEQVGMTQRQGIASATNLAQLSSNEREKALDREVQMAKVRVDEITNKLRSGELTIAQATTQLSNTNYRLAQLEDAAKKRFDDENAMLLMAEKSGKLKPEQKAALDRARAELNAEQRRLRERFAPIIDTAYKTLGIPTSSNIPPAQSKAFDQYRNK